MTFAGRVAKRVWLITKSDRLTLWTYQALSALQITYIGYLIKRRLKNV